MKGFVHLFKLNLKYNRLLFCMQRHENTEIEKHKVFLIAS